MVLKNRAIILPVLLIFLRVSFLSPLQADNETESGLYPVFNFSPKDYNALAQNWSCLQDQRGIMYFANNQGVLEYDGVNWDIIKVRKGSLVRSMNIDNSGRIYVGAVNEFGYLVPDSIGRMTYRSLSADLAGEFEFNDVWKTHITPTGIVFQCYHHLFIYEEDSVHCIPSEEEIHESFFVEGVLYVKFSEAGLARLIDRQFVPVQSQEKFLDKAIYGMVPIQPGRILIVTESNGLYYLNYSAGNFTTDRVYSIKTPDDELLKNIEIFDAIRVDGERISLGTWGYGAVIMDTAFNLITVLDKPAGLQDDIVQGQYIDRTGNLWLALSNGISRVEIRSPLTRFTDNKGLPGTIQAVTRFGGRIYATSNVGLYYLDLEPYASQVSGFSQPVFRAVPDINIECWDMITFRHHGEEILLMITNTYIAEIGYDNTSRKIFDEYPYDLYQSKLDSARVFVGLEDGLMSLYRENGQWTIEGRIEGIDEHITNLSEDHMGNLWMGTPEDVVLRMHIQYFEGNRIGEYTVTRYGSEDGLPEGPFIISQYKGPPIVATNRGLYKYILQEDRFEPDSSYGQRFAGDTFYIHRISDFDDPRIWMVTFSETAETQLGVGYLDQTSPGEFQWHDKAFARLSEGVIHAIYPEQDNVVWLGGEEGLFRYDFRSDKDYSQDYAAYLRRIELSEGELIFGGTYFNHAGIAGLYQTSVLRPVLPYSNNSLVFNYSAQPGEDESFMKFSYFLEGNDRDWSAWSPESKKEYTNLHEGRYTFMVKAMNIYNHESQVAEYKFTILAPWYRKWYAYLLYIVFGAFSIYSIVKVYTRQLRQIIRERTAEVVMQKEVIEAKNKDIMDSIQYAKKIQTALLPPEDDLGKLDLDGFILFLPRDIVSGDFYWIANRDGKTITVAADCTGHGVPGAFMSMLGVAFLNNIVSGNDSLSAGQILDELRTEVISALKQKGEEGEQKDGMDIALHIIDYENMKIEFAGANNPLILIRNNEIIQVKADRMPIGIHERAGQSFQNHVMDAVKGDVLYTYSDGFQDQFGGPKNKKFMVRKLKELFLEIHQRPMEEQKEVLHRTFRDWTVSSQQIDDVIVIGIRI
jgi:serine phosphatase RsbU (regulator of sigma subunit)/ligand-binding sensor domain-containing protein